MQKKSETERKTDAAFHEVFHNKPKTVDTSKSAAGQHKQMIAIALSKARAAGANIPKRDDGGVVSQTGPNEVKKGETIVNPAVPAQPNRGEDIPMYRTEKGTGPMAPSMNVLTAKPDWGEKKGLLHGGSQAHPIHAPAPKPPKMAERKFADMPKSKTMHDGGVVMQDGVYTLKRGETVVPTVGTESGRRPNPSGEQGLKGQSSSYHEYTEEIRPEGASNQGAHETSKQLATNYPGRSLPASEKVRDAKPEEGIGRACAERQVKGNVRNEDTVSSFGGKVYKA